MTKFDESQPHTMIWGIGGAQSYTQNGRTYNPRKQLIADAPAATPVAQQALAPEAPAGDLAQLHWKEIKVLVEAKGGAWTNKADAIVFLSK